MIRKYSYIRNLRAHFASSDAEEAFEELVERLEHLSRRKRINRYFADSVDPVEITVEAIEENPEIIEVAEERLADSKIIDELEELLLENAVSNGRTPKIKKRRYADVGYKLTEELGVSAGEIILKVLEKADTYAKQNISEEVREYIVEKYSPYLEKTGKSVRKSLWFLLVALAVTITLGAAYYSTGNLDLRHLLERLYYGSAAFVSVGIFSFVTSREVRKAWKRHVEDEQKRGLSDIIVVCEMTSRDRTSLALCLSRRMKDQGYLVPFANAALKTGAIEHKEYKILIEYAEA
jgi:hypothetical protein